MKVLIHDNVKTPHPPRVEYLKDQVREHLGRFEHAIHQIELTLTAEGHNGATEIHCHITASLGSLGVVAAEGSDANEHVAFKGAVDRVSRGIAKRIDKRQTRQKHAEPSVNHLEPAEESEVTGV